MEKIKSFFKKFARFMMFALPLIMIIAAITVYRSHIPPIKEGNCFIVDARDLFVRSKEEKIFPVPTYGIVVQNDIFKGETKSLIILPSLGFPIPMSKSISDFRSLSLVEVSCE